MEGFKEWVKDDRYADLFLRSNDSSILAQIYLDDNEIDVELHWVYFEPDDLKSEFLKIYSNIDFYKKFPIEDVKLMVEKFLKLKVFL